MEKPRTDSAIIAADRMQDAVRLIFMSAGSSRREAELVAAHLVEANLRGHDSHGVGLVPGYIGNARSGELVLNQILSVVVDTGAMLVFDGGQGAGQVMAHDATARGIERAQATGTCIVALRDSHHVGRIGQYAEQCASAGLVSVHFVNVVSDPAVAPFGGTASRLGTNPFAAGFPRPGHPPIVVDFATSRWAVGKVRVAFNKGEKVPPGTLLDAQGQPTLDPSTLFGVPPGTLLAFGEHKGFGLAFACELLAGAMTGGRMQTMPRSRPAVINSMFSVIVAPGSLGSVGSFAERVETSVDWVMSENRKGSTALLLPGQPELETREARLRDGIPLDPATLRQITDAARDVGLPALDLI